VGEVDEDYGAGLNDAKNLSGIFSGIIHKPEMSVG